jgi:hypothetical protein
MIIAYNKRMKATLSWSKLYTNKAEAMEVIDHAYAEEDDDDTALMLGKDV